MTYEALEKHILAYPGMWLDFPFDETTAVYKYGEKPEGKIVAVVAMDSKPLRVSLKCDPQLAKLLREKYESVLPATNLNKKHWNTILCTGQLAEDELLDLLRLSYRLAAEA